MNQALRDFRRFQESIEDQKHELAPLIEGLQQIRNMSKETAIQKLRDLQKQIEQQQKELKPLFNAGLAELFAQHPLATRLEVGINNHEFNDGDQTYFGVNYEDLEVEFSDGVTISPYGDDEGDATESHTAARDAFVKFFGEFDVDGFYETLFGDAYESITFKHKNGKVVVE